MERIMTYLVYYPLIVIASIGFIFGTAGIMI